MGKIELNLAVFDKDGNVTDETRTVSLEVHVIEAIVGHAVQIATMGSSASELDVVVDELVETLEVYDVVAPADGHAPG